MSFLLYDYRHVILTADQIRAARALKNWSQADLAKMVGMATPSIGNIEAGKHTPTMQTQTAIREAFEENGIEFIEGGVRLKQDLVRVYEGKDAYLRLLDDMFRILAPIKSEVLFSASDETRSSAEVIEKLRSIRRAGVKMRSLIQSDNSWMMGSLDEYRIMPHELFVESDVKVVFADITAHVISWKGDLKIILIKDSMIANEARRTFEYVWNASVRPTKTTANVVY